MDMQKATLAYIKIRDARAELKEAFDVKDKALRDKIETLEQAMLEQLKETNSTGDKNAAGTVSRVVKTRYWASDWGAFKQFVLRHEAVDLFENRIHQGNYKQFLEDNPDVAPPVNVDSKYSIRVTRGKRN